MLSKLYDGYIRITNAKMHDIMTTLIKYTSSLDPDVVAGAWLNEVEVDGVIYPYTLSVERRVTAKSGDVGYHQREGIGGVLKQFAHEVTVFIDDIPVTAFLVGNGPSIKMTYNSIAQAHQMEVLISVLDTIIPLVSPDAIIGTERLFNTPAVETAYSFN